MSEKFGNSSVNAMKNSQDSLGNSAGVALTQTPMVGAAEADGETARFTVEDVAQSIPRRFEQQVTKYPGRIAVKTRERELSYWELNLEANRVAQAILEARGPAQEPVAYLAKDDAKMVAAIFGILKAGKTYVPLNPEHPTAWSRRLMQDAQALLLLVESETFGAGREIGPGIELLDIDRIQSSGKDWVPNLEQSPESLAMILYTGGSTGQPKGVMQNHRNQLHNTMLHTNSLGLTADDRFCLVSARTSQQAMTGIYSALLNGAALYPFRIKEEGFERLAEWIEKEQITIYHSSASMFRQFAKSLGDNRKLEKVRVVKIGSEAASVADFEMWKKHFSQNCVFANALSSTETGTIRQFVADQSRLVNGVVLPAGYAVPDKEILLLTETGEVVKHGEVGEIAVRSKYLFLGYWRKPEETKRAIVEDTDKEGRRTYRTGDLGLLLPDGCLMHKGRKDLRVKIRGNRVELAEVELTLMDIEGVRQAAVRLEERHGAEPRLVAYVVAEREPAPSEESLRHELSKKLPETMVPALYVYLKELPLTPQGKVDRNALSASNFEHRTWVARHFLEFQVAEIWKEVLGVREISAGQNFFEAGGDSLLAIRLLDELEATFEKRFPPEILAGTVESLAKLIEKECQEEKPSLLLNTPGAHARKPLFFLHGEFQAGGLYAIRLARLLGEELPLYALQPMRRQGCPLPKSIEDMAEENLRRLLEVRPGGPYLLAGHCNGGLVALEIARRLRARGEKVEMLVVMDAIVHNPGLRFYDRLARVVAALFGLTEEERLYLFLRAKSFWERLLEQNGSQRLRYLVYGFGKWRVVARHLLGIQAWKKEEMTQKNELAPIASEGKSKELSDQEIYARFRLITRGYVPKRYDGMIELLVSEGRLRENQDATLGWAGVTNKLRVRVVPGDHQTYLTKHLPALAEHLKACFAESQGECGMAITGLR